ncbi:3-dehydroquinate synthase [Pseudohongiella sp.]|uniref:3-dehydroquinate synthase n=1 Tax=marine sediment metagenome TaxID=412755 RepID=A0A0F9Y4S2_9ZZZZ|nr:3-dehydroquinate synthase [Pseudohongiella sp.]HDZ10105.1 3-dehydroquinate synthase [Pseudohongiella sp.]HEA63454.1 3-dehydroquinate synthase [Pseudohongiella sp.]
MLKLDVDLGERSYPIFVGPGLLAQSGILNQYIKGSRVLVVTNEVVAPLYLDTLIATLQSVGNVQVDALVLPDGEHTKTLATLQLIYDELLGKRHERSTTLIALGGGVTGDITGFAAATYQRGVNFIQVPTTLLSQVDSSVGGKTGVNHPLGKNMIGAFYQPQCVLADIDVLSSLPVRELQAGLAEVIKYGLLGNAEFLLWLEQHIEALLAGDADLLTQAVKICCEEKARIVAADEREGGMRALLNLGHTFGHAIEAAMGYGNWLHGEAVATGMVMAADLSRRLGWISADDATRTRDLLARAGLPVCPPPEMTADQFRSLMSVDKKVQSGKVRFILLRRLGDAVIESDIDPALLEQTLTAGADLCR